LLKDDEFVEAAGPREIGFRSPQRNQEKQDARR
jgi:hypothetical protein